MSSLVFGTCGSREATCETRAVMSKLLRHVLSPKK